MTTSASTRYQQLGKSLSDAKALYNSNWEHVTATAIELRQAFYDYLGLPRQHLLMLFAPNQKFDVKQLKSIDNAKEAVVLSELGHWHFGLCLKQHPAGDPKLFPVSMTLFSFVVRIQDGKFFLDVQNNQNDPIDLSNVDYKAICDELYESVEDHYTNLMDFHNGKQPIKENNPIGFRLEGEDEALQGS